MALGHIDLDGDVFSRILSHITDSIVLYPVLHAFPNSHPFFPLALHRLCELPMYLDTWDADVAAMSNEVLDYLLAPKVDLNLPDIAESIRHLVLAVEHDRYYWPPDHWRPAPVVEDVEEVEEGIEEVHSTVEGEQEEEEAEEEEEQEPESEEKAEEAEEQDDVVTLHNKLPELFKRTRNLRSLEYHNCPGLPLSSESVEILGDCERLQSFVVDSVVRYTSWQTERAFEDPEAWDIGPFLSTLGPSIRSLDLRNVSQSVFLTLVSHRDILSTYSNLEHLKMDITEGVWDWDTRGSPQCGASEKYNFPTLGLPAIQRFELVVADLTIRDPRAGPLNIVNCTLLTHLSLDIRQCIMVYFVGNIKLFEGLAGAQFPMLSHLEIKDGNYMANSARLNWQNKGTENREDPDSEDSNSEGSEHSGVSKDWDHSEEGRYFAGLVPLFLPSLDTLVSLWLEESALLPGIETREGTGCYRFPSVRDLWNSDDAHFGTIDRAAWKAALQAFLPQLESLRVGFGVINAEDVGLILSCCNPTKLKQFGFTWAWKEYDRDAPISPELLEHLARFPRLTDVHILFPHPETQVSGTPDPVIDPLTLADVVSIFGCNGSICRVGIGNSVVWERHALGGEDPGVLLVSDGSSAPNYAMPRFYHAGYLAKYNLENEPDWRHDGDNTTPMRPKRGKEIGQLRDLLKRILE